MMTQAFYTGIAGLRSSSSGIDIMSDNIANVSTTGFKGQSYEFSSLFDSALATNNSGKSSVNSSIGQGAKLTATNIDLKSGTMVLSDRSTDLALQGEGWFGIIGNNQDVYYTRDGSFNFDVDNNLVANDGSYILGTLGNNISENTLTTPLAEVPLGGLNTQEKLRFPKTLAYPPEPTTTAKFLGNIGTTADVRTMSAAVVDPAGVKNDLRLEFTKSAVQTPPGTQWDVVAQTKSIDGSTVYDTQSGTISFGSAGELLSTTLSTIDNNGASVAIDLGSDFSGVVSLDNTEITASSLANGTIGGDLRGYDINKNGEVVATFTNGKQSSVGRIAVYHFRNDEGLGRVTGTRFAETTNSGKPLFYQDSSGQNIIGTDITNFKLEGSNISLTTGLTELIILQRAYDANSKSITTADQMIQKALTMHK